MIFTFDTVWYMCILCAMAIHLLSEDEAQIYNRKSVYLLLMRLIILMFVYCAIYFTILALTIIDEI